MNRPVHMSARTCTAARSCSDQSRTPLAYRFRAPTTWPPKDIGTPATAPTPSSVATDR